MLFSPDPAAASTSWAARAGLLVTLALSLAMATAVAGCGQRACIEWSEQEGVCPSREATLTEHIGSCTNITSVDDDGTREGNLCCYAVSKSGPLPDCSTPPPDTTSGVVDTTGGLNTCDGQGQCGDFFSFGCRACALTQLCSSDFNNCQSSSACANILSCEGKCATGDLQCKMFCENPNIDGVELFRALNDCLVCVSCPSDCFAASGQCSASTSTGGSGGAGGMSGTGGMGGMSGTGGAGGAGGKGGGP
jgi:uncharacterized membrane protein YgcG